MKLKAVSVAAWLVGMTLQACTSHFVADGDLRDAIHREFEDRQTVFTQGNAFDVFVQDMTTHEREAMEYLYASMTSADMADYTGSYFLENVRMAFRARQEMTWGKDLTDDLFMYFVLPVRINNERLDDFRKTYYDTLCQRVAGLSMHDAALEVNHWCHEHVTYAPSDARTLSPMACIKNALGRCGEESTLTVAALRTVGIPARQVYTPRWAHTDDNHAWVEVWTDGKWQFLGACEPEPALNMAWFNQPASRALLMHTRVTGDYRGREDIIKKTRCYTEINVIDTYAPVRKSTVTVVDTEGRPVAGAQVEFKIYNYAEFYSVVKLQADAHGQASLHMGLGDMLVWASHQGKFGFAKLEGEALTVVLQYREGVPLLIEEDIVPPVQGDIPVDVSEAAIALNQVRLAYEDSIRGSYLNTFYRSGQEKGYTAAEEALLTEARGNWKAVKQLIDGTHGDERARALALLQVLAPKDLHDTPYEVLADMMAATPAAPLTPDYVKYVLSPRMGNEYLQPYRTAIRKAMSPDGKEQLTAQDIIAWTQQHIDVDDDYNPIHLQTTPAGVLRLRHTDHRSRNRFFVAACRSFGIPAHMQTISGNPQYKQGDEWIEVNFGAAQQTIALKTGCVATRYDQQVVGATPMPKYEIHYTLAHFADGSFHTIYVDVADEQQVKPEMLIRKYQLDEGYYLLTTGNRMASGKVLSRCVSFNVKEGQTTAVDLCIRPAVDEVAVIGNMDPEALYLPAGADEPTSILSTTGRGYFMIAVMGATDEPTHHALHSLEAVSQELNAWGRKVIILNQTAQDAERMDRSLLTHLNAEYGIDTDGKIRAMLCNGCSKPRQTLPVIAICDSFGRIVYFSQGYNTSIDEQVKQVIHQL